MKAWKLFRIKKSGEITSLFINKKKALFFDTWMDAEDHPTKGFAQRPGWHCLKNPTAPHLKESLKSGEQRAWLQVEIQDYHQFKRPPSQGGVWFLAKRMRILTQEIPI